MARKVCGVTIPLGRDPIDERRLARLFGTALGLHAVVDPLLSYLVWAAAAGSELNPFLRLAMDQGIGIYVGVHLALIVTGSCLFVGLLVCIHSADRPIDRRLARALELGSVGAILWGIVLVAWNLSVLTGTAF